MGKITHFTGQPVLSQLLKFINKQDILSISRKGKYDRYTKSFDGYTHLVCLLFGVIMRFDSLREIVIGMMAEAPKLHHLGISAPPKRSTFAEANNRRNSKFFEKIYLSLYKRYRGLLADSRGDGMRLHVVDSTTITLFSNILKGAGRHPKTGRKKGGIKAHSALLYGEGIPYKVIYTSAATHDHIFLRDLDLHDGDTLVIDRAYIDIDEFEKYTRGGVTYVTKMKKNLKYNILSNKIIMDNEGHAVRIESEIEFPEGSGHCSHSARMLEYWTWREVDGRRKLDHRTLLTNSTSLTPEEIYAIYDCRWLIESLFKQLKQNFPLRYFYGESVNAIESQIWVTLIANLLLTIVKKLTKKKWAFSNLATNIRQMLMYYIDLFDYLSNPEKAWEQVNRRNCLSPPGQGQLLLQF